MLDASHGVGADLVYECVGRPDTVQVAVDLARRGGAMSLIGLAEGEAPINPSSWLTKEITVQGALAYTHEEFAMAMGMIADGRVDVDELHTCTVSLDSLDRVLAYRPGRHRRDEGARRPSMTSAPSPGLAVHGRLGAMEARPLPRRWSGPSRRRACGRSRTGPRRWPGRAPRRRCRPARRDAQRRTRADVLGRSSRCRRDRR